MLVAHPLQKQPDGHSSFGEGVFWPCLFIFPVQTLGTNNNPIITFFFLMESKDNFFPLFFFYR